MPRRRLKENEGLPKGWRRRHGAYYYQVPRGMAKHWDGKAEFRLGANLAEAYKTWAERLETPDDVRTIGQLLERYAIEVVPGKAAATRTGNARQIVILAKVFGAMRLNAIEPIMIRQYVARRKGKVAAQREIEVLSHAYSMAVEWGFIARHPFLGQVRFKANKPRMRYIKDWEIIEALQLPSHRKKGSVLVIQAYIRLKLLTGLAKSDLLRLEPARHFSDEGIEVTRHKTANSSGKATIFLWNDELRAAVKIALAARPVHISPYLFCTKMGEGYFNEETGLPSGWSSMWQRFMARVLKETRVTESFTDHDIRAKAGSDAGSLEDARALLQHANSATTERTYRRLPERVKTTRSGF